jgi:hypothetical protein
MEFVNGKDDIPYMMENKIDVWNHQPVYIYWSITSFHDDPNYDLT